MVRNECLLVQNRCGDGAGFGECRWRDEQGLERGLA